MTRMSVAAMLLAASVASMSGQGKPAAPAEAALGGTWKLNRDLSQFPRDIGFGMDVTGAVRPGSGERGVAEAGGESVNPGLVANRPPSREEAMNSRQMVDEVRNPPARLTITQGPGTVTVTDDLGRTRTYHTDGRDAFTPLDAAPAATVSRWDAGRLVIRYKVEPGREVRYTVSRRASPPQLVVQAELLERGGRDTVVRIYEPAAAGEPAAEQAPQQAPPVLTLPSQRPGAAQQPPPAQAPPAAAGGMMPAVPAAAAPADLDQRPGAELKGLSSLGVVVEDLGAEAVACGLQQSAIEAAAVKSLSSAGLKVVQNTDEDTYLYVHVITAASQTGTCFSRYDAYIYSNTAAKLSYGSRPALVQVSLLHKGGMATSATRGHGEAVTRAIAQYVDQFAAQIRNANK